MKLTNVTKGIAVFTMIVSLTVIAGWLLRVPALTSFWPGAISMKFNTAAEFVLLSLALVKFSSAPESPLVRYLAIAIIFLSALTLLEYMTGYSPGIDELFTKDFPGAANTIYPGRPSAFTAFCFMLLGIVLLYSRARNNEAVVWLSLMVVMLIGGMVVFSFLLHVEYLNSYTRLTRVAFPTGTLFLLNSVGISLLIKTRETNMMFVRRIIVICLVLIGSISLIFYFDNIGNQQEKDTGKVFENTRQQISGLDHAMNLLTRIESSIRGYLISGDSSLINHIDEDKIQLQQTLRLMRTYLGKDSLQANRLDSIQSMLLTRFSLFSEEIGIKQKKPDDQRKLQPIVLRSALLMDTMHAVQLRFIERENRQYAEEQSRNSSLANRSGHIIYFLGFLMLCILGILIVLIFQNARARVAAERKANALEHSFQEKLKEQTTELESDYKEMQRLALYLKDAREDERLQISLTVHDQLGQLASAIKMELDWLSMRLQGFTEKERKRIDHALSITDLMIDTSRNLATSLRPAIIDELGITAALNWQCAEFERKTQIPCHFRHSFDDRTLEKNKHTELFRICQEALSNVIQHAKASEVSVQLEETDAFVELMIEDNGIGFDSEQPNEKVGLISIRERAHAMQGELYIETEPGKGTRLMIRIPKINHYESITGR